MTQEKDPFVCWDAGQQYVTKIILEIIEAQKNEQNFTISPDYIKAIEAVLLNDTLEPALRAELLKLPSENDLAQAMAVIDVDNIHSKRYIDKWHKNITHVPQNIYLTDISFAKNIAFGIGEDKEIDLKNPKTNKKNAGFTVEEREGFDNIVKAGFIDTFREFHAEGGHYTWWSYMFQARKKDIGWRIDSVSYTHLTLPTKRIV